MRGLRLFVLLLFAGLSVSETAWGFAGPGAKDYAGSRRCGECHREIYDQWKLTSHANMLRNAKEDPDAVAARAFSAVPFKKEDIYWTIGSHWVQKYLTHIDNDWYVLPKYWNIPAGDWVAYSIFNWREKPYTIHCDGCHTTGFDPETKSFFEPSIGCEACHGPGKKHAESAVPSDIVNPAKLSKERRDMVCEQCHTDGKDKKAGGQFPFPALYRPGEDLNAYFTEFFTPKPNSKRWFWGTMDYKERHRMFMFWQSKFYSTTRACDVCGFDRGLAVKSESFLSRNEYCGTCHTKTLRLFQVHSRHSPQAVQCVDCHTPQVVDGGKRYSIHDHKFDFSAPELPCTECHETKEIEGKKAENHNFNFSRVKIPETLTIEEACARCHPGKDVAGTLKNWKNSRTGRRP